MRKAILIEGRVYRKDPRVDLYEIPFEELGEFKLKDIPRGSSIKVSLPVPANIETDFYVDNKSSDELIDFIVYGRAVLECNTDKDADRIAARIRKIYPSDPTRRLSPKGYRMGKDVHTDIDLMHIDDGDRRIKDIFAPIVAQTNLLWKPAYHFFICHASEDKPTARTLARSLRSLDAHVWLDEWEIRVGDSIVQKINDALSQVTHLIVLLSRASCTKSWVTKEWSSALMRQLSENSITILPVRLDDHPIPPILADLRYADCRASVRQGIAQLKKALLVVP